MPTRKMLRRRVLRCLLLADLEQVHAADIARRLHVSPSTLRRRLRAERTSYRELLDQVRQHRCRKTLARRWLPGKAIAPQLGYSQPNSFYRAFGKWTGMTYTQYKKALQKCSARDALRLY